MVKPSFPGSLLRKSIPTVLMTCGLLAVIAEHGLYRFGSIGAFVGALQGRLVYVYPAAQFVGDLKPGEKTNVEIHVRNLTRRPVSLLGSRASCACTTTSRLPITLAAGEVATIHVAVTAPKKPTPLFGSSVVLFTDVLNEQPTVRLEGRVSADQSSSG